MEHFALWCRVLDIEENDEKVLYSFEMLLWRRILRISWTEMKTNQWVRERIEAEKEDCIGKYIDRRTIVKYMHCKRRPESIFMTSSEGERMGKNKREKKNSLGRRTTSENRLEKCPWLVIMHGNTRLL